MIKGEYNYKEKTVNDTSLFTEYNLVDTEDSSIELNTSKSTILGPFNSTISMEEEVKDRKMEDKNIMKLKSKLREFDRRYERENNNKQDNGIYIKNEQLNVNTVRNEKKKIKSAIQSIISKDRI